MMKPLRITSTGTFIVKQNGVNIKHPYDLEADDLPGTFLKKEQTRFYEVREADGSFDISCHIHVSKDANGRVIGGTFNERIGTTKWVARQANLSKVYAVIRKRAVHKPTLEEHRVQFIRYIIFIMPLLEYNANYRNLKAKSCYHLQCSNMIVSYYFDSPEEVPVVGAKHGNAKNPLAPQFHSVAHSIRKEIQEAVSKNNTAAPRILKEQLTRDKSAIETSLSETVRNEKQISNYKQMHGARSSLANDEISSIMLEMFKEGPNDASDVIDKDQAFVQEMQIRHGKQANFVAYCKQTVNDVERFCCRDDAFTTLSMDTTFNVAEYHLTQTVFKYMAVLKRSDQRPPWFPGPVMAHRHKEKTDFAFFWQACSRGNTGLRNLRAFGTDEDEAIIQGILQETRNDTINLLGTEHAMKNVQRKLQQLSFPQRVASRITNEIFGRKDGLIECETKDQYDERLTMLKERWSDLERMHTKNKPPSKFVEYFTKHKENSLREKMLKPVRIAANEVGRF